MGLRSVFTIAVCSVFAAFTLSAKNIQCTLQACPVCSHKEYKATVLLALPQLTNLDGERNPHTCVYHDTLVQTHEAHEQLKEYDPEFKYDPPGPWFTQDMLTVPAVTLPDARRSMSVAVHIAGERLNRLESDICAIQELFIRGSGASWSCAK